MNINYLNLFYKNNLETYNNLKKNISNNINGRICHHSVLILHILVCKYNIKKYLEIGTHNGTSMSYVVNQNLQPLNCYGIDLFENNTTKHYLKDDLNFKKTYNNIEKNNISKSNINLIQGDSTNPNTISRLESLLKNSTIDLLFIDGNHSYEGVKSDFENYINFTSDRAIVVFDDYNKNWPGVVKFCNNDLKKYNFRVVGCFANNELILTK